VIVLRGLERGVKGLEISPDGSAALAWGDDFTAVWKLPDGGAPTLHRGLTGATFSRDGRAVLALAGAPPRIGSVGLQPGAAFTGSPLDENLFGWFAQGKLRLSPAGDRVAAANLHYPLHWWSWPGLDPLPRWASATFPGPVDCAFSPDGGSLAAFHLDGVCRHEAGTGEVRWKRKVKTTGGVGTVAWSSDGRFIVAGSGRSVHVLNAANGRTVRKLTQKRKYVLDLDLTPDGRFLATVSHEKTVKFYDTDAWELRHELAWEIGALRAVAFSKDGMLAAAGGIGKKVVVWDFDL
jgi:WD40 repeat protein